MTQRYEPSAGKTITWNVTATDVDVEIERESQARYNDVFNITDQDEITIASIQHRMYFEAANVGAGVGGGFENTQELRVITYNKAINRPDGEHWKAEVENGYQQMRHNKGFETVMIANLPPGTKLIDSVWAMKKKNSGVLSGRINARGFKQVERQHYDGTIPATATSSQKAPC